MNIIIEKICIDRQLSLYTLYGHDEICSLLAYLVYIKNALLQCPFSENTLRMSSDYKLIHMGHFSEFLIRKASTTCYVKICRYVYQW